MKKLLKLGLLLLLTLTSCNKTSSSLSMSSFISSTSSNISLNTSTSTYTITDNKEYQKDEDGFFILEDDYFKNYSKEDNKDTSKVRFIESIDDELKYSQMRMYIGDKQVPLYNVKTNISQTWSGEAPSRMNNAVSIIELEGKVNIKIQTNFSILEECVIRPLSAGIIPIIDESRRVISFEVTSPGQYTIEFRSRRTLHLFVDEYKQYDDYKQSSNLIYFGPGIHTKDNSQYINNYHEIILNSNTTVFIDQGAVIRGAFRANNKENIKLIGSGIIDGSTFERSVERGTTKVPYDFQYCKNIEIKGITTLDPAGWCYNLYYCKDVIMDNVKLISSRSNGDGISVQSCENVTITNTFVRSWDDSLVVKNYPYYQDRSHHGSTKNILFENCILWTDLAQSMEVGYETVGEILEDVTFNNITVLHNFHKAVISIHNANNANIKRVKFTNITVEDLSTGKGDGNKIFIDIANIFSSNWSTNWTTTSLGSIDDVLVDNVKVVSGHIDAEVKVSGTKDPRKDFNYTTHYVNNVTIKDVIIKDKIVDETYSNLTVNLTNNLKFEKSNNIITGAVINYKDVSNYGTNYILDII